MPSGSIRMEQDYGHSRIGLLSIVGLEHAYVLPEELEQLADGGAVAGSYTLLVALDTLGSLFRLIPARFLDEFLAFVLDGYTERHILRQSPGQSLLRVAA